MGYADQVLGRAGNKGVFTILYRCKNCGLMLKDDFTWFTMRSREFARSHKARTGCCCADCGVPSEHQTGTCIVTMHWSIRLNTHRTENVSR